MKKIECETDWFAHPDEFRTDKYQIIHSMIHFEMYHRKKFKWNNFRWLFVKYFDLIRHAIDENYYSGRTCQLMTIYSNWLAGHGVHPFDSSFVAVRIYRSQSNDIVDDEVLRLHQYMQRYQVFDTLLKLVVLFSFMPPDQSCDLKEPFSQSGLALARNWLARKDEDAREKEVFEDHRYQICTHFCEEIRCILGNPFRPVTINPVWRRGEILELADTIDAGERFDLMPILADALEDAGCHDPDVLSHCRDWKIHSRGCWLIDGLLDGPINLSEPTSGRKSMFDPIP